jgi:N-acyl homoserine lactone hydrolase
MSVNAEPSPLEEPLERGRAGVSLVIEPLLAGEVIRPATFFAAHGRGPIKRLRALGEGSPESREVRPVPVYLARHPTVGNILVDTGLHPSVARDPRDNLGRFSARHYRVEAGKDLVSQLRGRRLTPHDIRVVVLTHLHEGHASGIEAFPRAKFVVSATEWEEATTGSRPRFRGYNRSHYDYAFEFFTVDFDGPRVESYGPFGRSFDLFGDGSVRLAYTPGHSAGHVSVILRLPRRDFVVIGDAAADWKQFEGQAEPMLIQDEHNWRRSLRELQAYRRAYPHALMVPGHDREFWEKLKRRYEE